MGPANLSNVHLQIPLGFTLVEVITAIGVLAILAAAVIAALDPLEQFKKTQDSKRKADLAQVQRALEVYYQDFGSYPSSNPAGEIVTNDQNDPVKEWGTDWRPYMDVLPIDPVQSKNYAYWSDTTGQSYAIYASLDRGARDQNTCNDGAACTNAAANSLTCGAGVCDFGVSSPNIAP